ncbi:MAG: PEGA domain-containing protein [Planctomycetes bacterium]|nr:PEGA domain-containing protein [Planctomycetota bacterium]
MSCIAQARRKGCWGLLGTVLGTCSLTGCATIVGGYHDQKVHIDSNPRGAQVLIDGQMEGTTPVEVPLNRRTEHRVELDAPGCQPYVTTLKPGINPWLFGNLVVGGIPGLVVDACTGATSALYPKSVTGTMTPLPPGYPAPPANAMTGNPPVQGAIQPAGYQVPATPQPLQ